MNIAIEIDEKSIWSEKHDGLYFSVIANGKSLPFYISADTLSSCPKRAQLWPDTFNLNRPFLLKVVEHLISSGKLESGVWGTRITTKHLQEANAA